PPDRPQVGELPLLEERRRAGRQRVPRRVDQAEELLQRRLGQRRRRSVWVEVERVELVGSGCLELDADPSGQRGARRRRGRTEQPDLLVGGSGRVEQPLVGREPIALLLTLEGCLLRRRRRVRVQVTAQHLDADAHLPDLLLNLLAGGWQLAEWLVEVV